MAGEPTLYARMELRLNEFEKKLARATKSADQTMGKIERRGNQMTAKLQGVGTGAFAGLLKGAALAIAPILSVGAAIATVKDGLAEFGDIADASLSAGLDAEFFQSLAEQARLGGVGVDALSGALDTFNKNSGLAVVNKGKMVSALKALNPELLANIQAATNQEQRVRLAADAIAAAGTASERAALSTALFGDAGAKLASVFSGGSTQIDAAAAAARKLGLIIDRDLIARADQMGDEFDVATRVMDLQFKQALIDLAPILTATASLAGNVATAIGYITDSMQQLSLRGTARLEQDLAGLDETLAEASTQYAPGVVGTMGVEVNSEGIDKIKAERDAIYAELRRRATDQLRIGLANIPRDTAEVGDSGDTGGGATRNQAAEATLRQAEATRSLIEQLQFEKQIVGETALEQEILNTLRNAGVDATSAQGLAIRQLVTELDAQKTSLAASAEAMQQFEGIATNSLSSFVSDLREGKSAAEALSGVMNSILDNVIQIGIQSLVGGLGGGGGLFAGIGKLFGFASGGYTGPGAKNKPAGIVHAGEFVFTKAQTEKLGIGNLAQLAKGYANGGYVGSSIPTLARPANNNGGALTVHVSLDSEMLRAEVRDTANRVVAQAAPAIVGRANKSAPGAVVDTQRRFGL